MSERTVFVVMPFSDDLAVLWKSGILRICQDLGWTCKRADDITTPGSVVGQLYESINQADVIIGEMTGRNPNVFYEIGYAHALGKPTILLATSADDLKAFDAQGFRHLIHFGDPAIVRTTLKKVLDECELQLSAEITVPGGKTLYEWPSREHEPPDFRWVSNKPGHELQIDVNGGQRTISSPGVDELISICNTDLLWNHRPGRSVMRLLQTKEFSAGDILHVFIDGRTTNTGQFDVVGDGGWVGPATDHKWAEGWAEQHKGIQTTTMWTQWQFTIEIAPTQPEYDLRRGITVYLVTNVEQGNVLIRRIRLIRRAMPGKASPAT